VRFTTNFTHIRNKFLTSKHSLRKLATPKLDPSLSHMGTHRTKRGTLSKFSLKCRKWVTNPLCSTAT
jgi:hypothetical protein